MLVPPLNQLLGLTHPRTPHPMLFCSLQPRCSALPLSSTLDHIAIFDPLRDRPILTSAEAFSDLNLLDFLTVDHFRLRLEGLQTLGDLTPANAPTVGPKYYHSLAEVSVAATCACELTPELIWTLVRDPSRWLPIRT